MTFHICLISFLLQLVFVGILLKLETNVVLYIKQYLRSGGECMRSAYFRSLKCYFVAAFATLFVFFLQYFQAEAQTSTSSTPAVTISTFVNFSQPIAPEPMSGFLHGIDYFNPPNSLLQPLKPALWRTGTTDLTLYNRMANLGAKVEVVISDSYGYPFNNWNGNGAPYLNNWQNWAAHVDQVAQLYKNYYTNIYWDVWNEPDSQPWNAAVFWNGTPAQFYETYRQAYIVLRRDLGPYAMIGGPSFANYDPVALTNFLQYCNNNGLQVNFLSWHELNAVDNNIPAIVSHIQYMKNIVQSMPNLKVKKIFINESVGTASQYLPGEILGYLYYMEKGGADGANKACWNDSSGNNNCFNNSVDGIVNPSSGQYVPRAAWWTYKTYADSVGTRVLALSQYSNLVVMASTNPAQILVGYFGNNQYNSVSVKLQLYNLAKVGITGTSVGISLYKIPATGEASLPRPILVSNYRIPVVGGNAVAKIPSIGLHEEYVVTFSP